MDRASALRIFDGNEAVLQKCYAMFAEEIVNRKAPFRKAYEDADFEEIENQAHFLKGISINLGAEFCHVSAEKLEYAARERNLDQVRSFYPRLEEELMKVKELLAITMVRTVFATRWFQRIC